jgi:hypothetical protein
MFHYQAQWWQSRLNGRCRGCNKHRPDPVSLMCVTCYKRYKRDGSPSIKRPQLKHEIKQAEAILERYDLEEAQTRFKGWMRSYARASQGALNWLCREFFFDLKGCNGEPLMDLKQAIKQTLAVSLYNGVLDEKRQAASISLRTGFYEPSRATKRGQGGTVSPDRCYEASKAV